ncbi:MAG: hypothetical protein GY868_13250, partial [Deltaproteobacteria bacterium]|nr:hypothetical protein [Deltaproteobacteria bacterium]
MKNKVLQILSKTEFNKTLQRERIRSARADQEFSVAMLEVGHVFAVADHSESFSHLIGQRIRCYDVIGWLDSTIMGMLLPDTAANGAHGLVEDICRSLPDALGAIDYSIIEYPSQVVSGKRNANLVCVDVHELRRTLK